jgi:hypothetical protein
MLSMKTKLLLGLLCAVLGSACVAPRSKTTTVTARPKFTQEKQLQSLVVADGNHSFDLLWSAQSASGPTLFFPFKLNPRETYVFTIEEQPHNMTEETGGPKLGSGKSEYIMFPNLVRVTHDGTVIYDRAVCEVHHCQMEHRKVPIVYGLFTAHGEQPTYKQERTEFPHHTDFLAGGCIVAPKKKDYIYICPQCVAAYQKWEQASVPKTKQ